MNKLLFILLTILTTITVFSDAYLLTKPSTPLEFKTIKKSSEFFVNSNIFESDNISKNSNNNIFFYVYNQKILEINLKNQYSKIDFNKKYENSILESEGEVYIRKDVIENFLFLKSYETVQNLYFFDQMPLIKDIVFTNNKFEIEFDRTIHDSMFNINEVNSSIILSIKPVLDIKFIPSNLNYTYDRGQIYLKFNDIPNYEKSIKGPRFTLDFNYSEKFMPVKEINNNYKGLEYDQGKYLVSGNEIQVYSLKIDPSKYDFQIGLNNLGNSKTVKSYFEDNQDIIASINASFFDVKTLEPLGNIIVNGEIQHLSAYSRPAFFINKNGKMNIDYVKLEYKVNLDGMLFWVKSVNSKWKAEVKIYTSKYKGEIEESFEEYLFFVIEDSEIKKINSKDYSESQKLLIISKKYEKYLQEIKVGSDVTFDITYSENIESSIKTLVEGGPILLNDEYSEEMLLEEKRAYSNGIIYGKSPRTAFAIDNENMVTFIVVEGYVDENLGLNYDGMKELLDLMGNYKKAIMFDGGGSSLFYYDGKIMNNGSERLRDYIPVFINIYPVDK
ncbi:phosphodiester glycosidase family protein [Geotoga petraea]|uniref:Phosphodiester glycosidase domain-containing protein n=1 Tax=Geotoga petraea TaxID=28234 RepID=A0A1G6JJE8_9BACT|nr:phosphodiester glycosidase family protein [Geotoga petraea]MDK2945381.1 hypothetical protein [Geotoga sp.]TGG88238.1 hypothetical protein E4650_04155 [Geotoga petraea]SDC18870.1 Predicted protein [Geotoga petraea]